MKLQELSLFLSKKELFVFVFLTLFTLAYSLLIEFNNYTKLTQFNSNIVTATVLKQYEKNRINKKGKSKSYQVLQLQSDEGFKFYTTAPLSLENVLEKSVILEIWAGKISFYEYLTTFFAFSKIVSIDETATLKERLNTYLFHAHTSKDVASIYQALYTAKPLTRDLQTIFSNLGISHLFAISGFHLGILSALLLFLILKPYSFLHKSYFPYRNLRRDTFVLVSLVLLAYLLFLDSPPSLLRAFAMLIIGFILYDRGVKIISMQTLFLTTITLLALFPKLFFALGFWLSIAGVFYIFLFLIHFQNLSKKLQFLLTPIWVYFVMLPFSLAIFSNFSLYHPLSIIWTTLFTLFYPLSILMHLINLDTLFDFLLNYLLHLGENTTKVFLSPELLYTQILLSFGAVYKKSFLWPLLLLTLIIFLYAFTRL